MFSAQTSSLLVRLQRVPRGREPVLGLERGGPGHPLQREECKQGLLGRKTEWLGEQSTLDSNDAILTAAELWSQQLLRILMNAEARVSSVQSWDADEDEVTGHPGLINYGVKRGR